MGKAFLIILLAAGTSIVTSALSYAAFKAYDEEEANRKKAEEKKEESQSTASPLDEVPKE